MTLSESYGGRTNIIIETHLVSTIGLYDMANFKENFKPRLGEGILKTSLFGSRLSSSRLMYFYLKKINSMVGII